MPAYRNSDKRWRYRKWIELPDGKRIRITGTPKTDTKVAAEAAERMHIDRVMYPERHAALATQVVPKRKEMPTVDDFAERFMNEYLPRQKPSERKSKRYILNSHLMPFFGPMRLDEIDQSHINGFVTTQAHLATKTVNNRLTVLSTMLRYAGPTGCKLIPETLLSFHISSMSAEIVAVPKADVAKLIEKADLWFRVAVLLAAEAGLRVGEIRGLQHGDVREGQLTVRRAIDQSNNVTSPKHDKSRMVPLSPALATILPTLPKVGLWVLAESNGQPKSYERLLDGINALYKLSGVSVPVSESGVTMPWHSLRHTFGTEAAAQNVPLPVIKELMGHGDIKTTMRYVTVTTSQLFAGIAQAFGTERQTVGKTADRSPKKENAQEVNS